MAEFDAKQRNLERFLADREKRKKEGSKEGGVLKESGDKEERGKRGDEGGAKAEVQELDGGREQQIEIKKESHGAAGQRESQKLGTSATTTMKKKLLRVSR